MHLEGILKEANLEEQLESHSIYRILGNGVVLLVYIFTVHLILTLKLTAQVQEEQHLFSY